MVVAISIELAITSSSSLMVFTTDARVLLARLEVEVKRCEPIEEKVDPSDVGLIIGISGTTHWRTESDAEINKSPSRLVLEDNNGQTNVLSDCLLPTDTLKCLE